MHPLEVHINAILQTSSQRGLGPDIGNYWLYPRTEWEKLPPEMIAASYSPDLTWVRFARSY